MAVLSDLSDLSVMSVSVVRVGTWLLGLLWVASAASVSNSSFDPLDWVDPLIGSSNGGNVFPGASLPYGMAKAVADTNSDSNQGGFTLDGSPVTGFSMMHDSGTGGSPSLGNFPLFAYAACANDTVDGCVFPKKERYVYGSFDASSVSARPGVFGLTLDSGLAVNMTATAHAALFRFTFPASDDASTVPSPLLLQDLSDLSDSRQDNATVQVDPTTGRITGNARFEASFGSGTYVLYFCTDFAGGDVRDSGIFVNSRASTAVHNLTDLSRSINGYPLPGGAFVRFNGTAGAQAITARVATSYVSVAQACAHAEEEAPDFDLEAAAAAAQAAWRDKLGRVVVTTGADNDTGNSLLTNFYSGIYRTMINPQNYTGENPLWSSSEPYFDSFYCLWDLFRSQLPFLTIVDPAAVTEMVRSLVDTYRHLGWLPDCRMSLCKGYTQGGSNADNVLADAYVKGLGQNGSSSAAGGTINWADAYAAMVRDAEDEPVDWSSEGRGGLDSWKALGYIPAQDFDYKGFGTMTRSVSRTLEYSYNDFCVAQVAADLGGSEDAAKYLGRSGNWRNLFRDDERSLWANGTDTGFTGFFEPRFLNGTWAEQDPLACSNVDTGSEACSLQNTGQETFESSLWEYGFFVPHDQASLVEVYGGADAFVARLDYLHANNITYIGNEPAFLTVFQYHYAGRPGLSARRAHYYVPGFFGTTPDGLPGNDDSGAMGSFVAMTMMGLFPNPGQNVYLVTPPFFARVDVTHPLTGQTATIRCTNFDASFTEIYIQNATLNGLPYTKSYVDHSFFTEGKELVLTLGRNESASWGRGDDNVPPSLGISGRL